MVAIKNLSLAEEYLADHFPGFPVMPGVLMLEALTQAGAWLIRDMEDFAHSVILLKQAKTIKYGSFVEPGRQLQLRVELAAHGERESTFKGVGMIDEQVMVKGRFTLTRYNLRDRDPELHATDAAIVDEPARPVRDPPQGLGGGAGDAPGRPDGRSSGRRPAPDGGLTGANPVDRGRRADDVARFRENQQDRSRPAGPCHHRDALPYDGLAERTCRNSKWLKLPDLFRRRLGGLPALRRP